MWIVVIDANVWVSAFAFHGRIPNQILALVKSRQIRSVTSEPLMDQVVRALTRLGTSDDAVRAAEISMRQISRLVRPAVRIEAILDKESDNRVLECAVAGQVDAIVTGDRKHLLSLRRYAGIPILSPSDFLEAWQRDAS
ncbi:MAG TPA: putative toxin-antitoxin system toxin component, PIN family [Thermomicrobiales bacterium]|nr:putative toxin-antitoxin system toxin component, PIN family [Thermomicrobiales bacterium]